MKSDIFRTVTTTAAVAFLAIGSTASAEEIHRSNWVPNVGSLDFFNGGEQPLGDMWTFNCPGRGTVNVSVDTKDDTDVGSADIDPILFVIDGAGNLLASADDNVECTYPPVCGFDCPAVVGLSCGTGGRHSIVVRDFGAADNTGTPCQEGGGYELTVEVFNAIGNQLPASGVNLGGGPNRNLPAWARNLGKAPVGPVLDDEDVPFGFELFDAAARGVTADALVTK